MRSRARHFLDGMFARLWGVGCWVLGLGRRRVERWRSFGKQRVLVIAPHPDDEIACAGTMVLHQLIGDQVTVLHVTDGRRSRAGGLDAETMARVRRGEARASLQSLGVTRGEWLGLPEGDWSDANLAEPLRRLLADLQPQFVYVPSRVDFHPEHYRVACLTARALAAAASDANVVVRVYQVQVPLTRALVNLVSPIAEVLPAVRRSWASYPSQESSLRAAWRLRRYAAGSHRLRGMAEEFWQLSGPEYIALHAEEPPRPLLETFRGLRRLGLTDPLSFLVGRAERRRLRKLAAATAS